ncbi:MAG: glucosaminidase domain-containing protein [Acidimicrobiia bacterium]
MPLLSVRRARFAALVPALVAALCATTALGALPAGAQADPFDAEIEAARVQVEQAQSEAHAANDKLEATRARQGEVQARVAVVEAEVARLQAEIPKLRAKAEQLRQTVRERAAALYSSGGPAAVYGPISMTPSLEAARRRILADAAAKRDDQNMEELRATAAQLADAEQKLQTEQTALATEQAELTDLEAQLTSQQAELDRRVAAANAALERARTIGALRARGEPIQGPTVLNAGQMAAWIRAKGYSPRIETSIDDLAQIYVDEGTAEGVRGDFAFAQSVIETGGFRSSPSNNFAGLGWCDSCAHGTDFPTPRDGVRAQIQHLKNYADTTSRASGLANPPSPYWYSSDPASASRKFDTFFAKGWAPTWNDMGHGNWATDKAYSGKVIGVYGSMVQFARTGSL